MACCHTVKQIAPRSSATNTMAASRPVNRSTTSQTPFQTQEEQSAHLGYQAARQPGSPAARKA